MPVGVSWATLSDQKIVFMNRKVYRDIRIRNWATILSIFGMD